MLRTVSGLLALVMTSSAGAQLATPQPNATAAALSAMAADRSKVPPGYLAGKPPVAILKVLPPPPAHDSAQDIADRAIYAASAVGIDGPAWKEAVSELNPASSAYFAKLSCAVGKTLSPATTPMTLALIARAAVDFAGPMDTAKNHYKRLRPFTTDKGRACDPITDDGIGERLGYSYPSGHSGIGWMWALILSDAAPDNATAIRAFGQATGDLRVACRVHWLSDVAYGRVLATAVYDRLAAEPEFQADVARAQAELAKAPVLTCPKS
ncbi:MAG: acid phosphatase [Polymorphobacter sp.]